MLTDEDEKELWRLLRKYAKAIGIEREYSAHSIRATFITTALEIVSSFEVVRRAAGHHRAL
jgi:site-specific recombinase XerD